MNANSRWKLYVLISRNIGKRLSKVLKVEDVCFNDLRLTYENNVIYDEGDSVIVYSLETKFSLLKYYKLTEKFYYRGNSLWWIEFDIDSILNNDFEDIV